MANVAENIIVKNFDDSEFVCRDIAETLGISEVYLRLIFKNEYGTSPGQDMLKVRMSEAWDLLADGISVSEVAGRVGYCDIFRFSKAFKKYYGYSSKNVKMNSVKIPYAKA